MTSRLDWIRDLWGRLVAYLHVVSGSRDDAEDLAQEVSLTYLDKGPDPGPRAEGWLFRTARNCAFTLIRGERRRRARQNAVAERRPTMIDIPPDHDLQQHENLQLLEHCLQTLDGPLREMLYLKVGEGHTYSELAERFDLPRATVARHVRDGLARLQECVRQQAP